MCGISLEVFSCCCHAVCARNSKKIPELLLNRGPDVSSCDTLLLDEVSIVLKGTVLWLQGAEPVVQPIRDEDGNILLFNGDVLAGDKMPAAGECDSLHLLQQLRAAGDEGVPGVMSGILGPWAFIYWHAATQQLYFGRDVLGRHSLLWSKPKILPQSLTALENGLNIEREHERHSNEISGKLLHSPSFVLSSVDCSSMDMEEVPAEGIFVLNIKALGCIAGKNEFPVALMPWNGKSHKLKDKDWNIPILDNISLLSPVLESINMTLPETGSDEKIGNFDGSIFEYMREKYVCYTRQFLFLLQRSVQRRVDACPPYCTSCIQNRVEQQKSHCTGNENGLFYTNSIGAMTKNSSFSKVNDYLRRLNDSNTSCEVKKCGCIGTDECKCSHIGISKTDTIHAEKIQESSNIACKSMTRNEVKKLSRRSTDVCTKISNDKSYQQDASSSSAGGECSKENMKSFTKSESACNHCRIAVLFSGGLDSAVIAFLLDRCLPKRESIDLINVAFPAPKPKTLVKTNKRQVSKAKLKNQTKYSVRRAKDEENLSGVQGIHEDKDDSQSPQSIPVTPLHFTETPNVRESQKNRTVLSEAKCDSSSSLSSAVSLQNGSKISSEEYEVPDRCTGRECLEQLKSLCPDRHWNFVEVNVSREELSEHRAHRISSLLRPHNTVLDDSIGCALWFAGRARGLARGDVYTSTARVLLCGHGADEQLCGYSRHRSVYSAGGVGALLEEIRMEVERLPSRNLGRDDRVLSDSARAPRFPYLDEDVVSYLNSLPIWVKADLSLPRGVGEKLLLRIMAHQLGLTVAAGLPKRAIQFGSRIAKMDDRKEKGDQVCGRLLNG